jgi:hypothetical protein
MGGKKKKKGEGRGKIKKRQGMWKERESKVDLEV